MISCQAVAQIIDELAPKNLMMEWDNCGLLLGEYSKRVSKLLLTLTVNPEALEYAVKNDVDMIVSHHPLFFRPVKSLRRDLPLGNLVYEAILHDIAVYAAHTNLDTALGGVNDVLAQKLELQSVKVLRKTSQESLKKLVIFVPKGHEESVREALGTAGAGFIGNYSHCSFNTEGVGTFKPLEGTSPFIGERGRLERVEEVRIETIVPETSVKKAVRAMLKVHPYEEAAYDIYPLDNPGEIRGLGRVGTLKNSTTLKNFCETVKNTLKIRNLRVVGDLSRPVGKVAVCGGAGGDMVSAAVFAGAEVLVTGDVKYHDAEDAKATGIAIIDAGHFATENLMMPVLAEFLEQKTKSLNETLEITVYNGEDPFIYF